MGNSSITEFPIGTFIPDKRLGQNFLLDQDKINEIVEGSNIDKNTLVIEIGPGLGAITFPLAKKAGRVIAIELDERLICPLRERARDFENVEIIHSDILDADLNSIIRENKRAYDLRSAKIVSNIPYYITSPIIVKLFEEKAAVESITLLLQKEAAERLTALPGTEKASSLTYLVNYYSDVRFITDIGRSCFYPVPSVDSAVIRMDILQKPRVKVSDEVFFFHCLRTCFTYRYAMIPNALLMLGTYKKEEIILALLRADIGLRRKAESLTMEEYAGLTEELIAVNGSI